MTKYAALLRGIGPSNPNMHSAPLKKFFESLGMKNVATVISSGNVVFESNKDAKTLETIIEKELPKKLGFTSTTIIRSEEQLKNLVKNNLFGRINDKPSSRLNVTFLKNSGSVEPMKGDGFRILGTYDNAVFSVIDTSVQGRTINLMNLLEKRFDKKVTTRTWKTVHRILKKME